MPPLLEEETIPLARHTGQTNFGGTACENAVKRYFLSQGINIAEPHVDDGVDLLIERPGSWVRGQVKKVVYQSAPDVIKTTGETVYRSKFSFQYQSSGKKERNGNGQGRRQRKSGEIDFFYHVLMTPYRELIWETPENLIPLRENGEYIHSKNPNLDSNGWVRKKAEIDYNTLLLYTRYDPIIFKTYPDFFLKKESTLENFLDYE